MGFALRPPLVQIYSPDHYSSDPTAYGVAGLVTADAPSYLDMELCLLWSGARASLGAISEWGAASGNAHQLSSRCLRCIVDGGPVRPEPGAVRRTDVLGKSPLTVGRPWLVRINAVCGPPHNTVM